MKMRRSFIPNKAGVDRMFREIYGPPCDPEINCGTCPKQLKEIKRALMTYFRKVKGSKP